MDFPWVASVIIYVVYREFLPHDFHWIMSDSALNRSIRGGFNVLFFGRQWLALPGRNDFRRFGPLSFTSCLSASAGEGKPRKVGILGW